MRSCARKCLRLLIAFTVAMFLTGARAQTEIAVGSAGSTRQGSTSSSCADGEFSVCGAPSTVESHATPFGDGSVGSSSRSCPKMSPGAPNAPMSVCRDDADGLDRTTGFRQGLVGPIKTQPLTEFQIFQMLVADSIGRIVSDPAMPPEEK